jgi:hypothetical protein
VTDLMQDRELAELSARVEKAESLLAEAVGVLKDCEFADNSGGEYRRLCPSCEGAYHVPNCALASVLSRVGGGM